MRKTKAQLEIKGAGDLYAAMTALEKYGPSAGNRERNRQVAKWIRILSSAISTYQLANAISIAIAHWPDPQNVPAH